MCFFGRHRKIYNCRKYFSIFDTIFPANVIQDFEINKQNKYSEKNLTFVLVIGLTAIYYFIISQPLVYKMVTFGG